MTKLITALRSDRHAAAALEFGLVAPVFLMLLFAVLGLGLDGFYQFVLDDAVRNATRQMQIAGPASTSGTGFVAAVCSEFGVVASDCSTAITYRVRASTQAAGFASIPPVALPATGSLDNSFFSSGTAFGAGLNLVVQVAYPLPFTLPYVATLVTWTGANALLSTFGAAAEPFS